VDVTDRNVFVGVHPADVLDFEKGADGIVVVVHGSARTDHATDHVNPSAKSHVAAIGDYVAEGVGLVVQSCGFVVDLLAEMCELEGGGRVWL
jgi:hypothetical protein